MYVVPPPIPSTQPPQYFEGNRRGEIAELKNVLKNILNEKDEKKKRETIKKVIAFMTLGVDVSRLFSEMCLASYTNDIIQKKMIYLYLTTYAESNAELAVMAINTFRKDAQHQDPKIRGLALRNLSSLQFKGSNEYLMPVIIQSLKDQDAYVRKTAVIGVLKVFYANKELILDSDIVEQLYKLIKDTDPLVIINSINVLNEILHDEGGISVSNKMIVYLLNRLKDFNEQGQTVIIQLLNKHKVKTEQEKFDIMNLLEDRLKQSCVSVVLATIQIFINLTSDNPNLYKQVIERVKSPLLTLISGGETGGTQEISYVVLSHILHLVNKNCAKFFEKEYKTFYLKIDEPQYIKFIKLNILASIASENNLGDLLNELGEYVTDIDTEISKKSIEALGQIALKLPDMVSPIVKQLSVFIALQKEYITNQVVIVFKDILRKHPLQYKEIISILGQVLENINEDESKIALIWILGEYADKYDMSPYLLENYVLAIEDNQEQIQIKHAVLSATVKCFFHRPLETQGILGKLLSKLISEDNQEIDLQERCLYYYNILRTNPGDLKKIFSSCNGIVQFLEEERKEKEKDGIEFNSLSIIYRKNKEKFLKEWDYFKQLKFKEQEAKMEAQQQEELQNQTLQETQPITEVKQQAQTQSLDLLDLDSSSQQNIQIQQPQVYQQNVPIALPEVFIKTIKFEDLIANPVVDAELFENHWTSLTECSQMTRLIEKRMSDEEIEGSLNEWRVYSIASGTQDSIMRFYVYSQHNDGTMLYAEVELNLQVNTVSIQTKSTDEEQGGYYGKYLETALNKLEIIK